MPEHALGNTRAMKGGIAPCMSERQCAFEEQMHVDLPAVAHRAVHLNGRSRSQIGGFAGDQLGVARGRVASR